MQEKKTQNKFKNTPSLSPYNQMMWSPETTYSVYIHHKRDHEDTDKLICWEKRNTTKKRKKAKERAKSLNKTNN